jgi:hypothetical protein
MYFESQDLHALLISRKQLLTIWRKAKEKERDVLLWGDEVGEPNLLSLHRN